MREIKFRAWYSSDTKEMMLHEDYPGQVFKWFSENQPLEIMQYTGLKDKNGTEIYEGDVITVEYPRKKYLVSYDKDRAGYYPFAQDDGCGCCSDELVSRPDYCEVIGNKFENPELLNNYKGEV